MNLKKRALIGLPMLLLAGFLIFDDIYCQYRALKDTKAADLFSPQFILSNTNSTCNLVSQRDHYYNCFIPFAEKFISEKDLGPTGVRLVLVMGIAVIEGIQFNNQIEKDFAALHLATFGIDQLQNCSVYGAQEQQAIEIFIKPIYSLASKAIQDLQEKLSRMPTDSASSRYSEILKMYEQRFNADIK